MPLGFTLSYYSNNNKIHDLLGKFKITRETSYPSEWFSAYLDATYVVLHLEGERRLYGWPKEWPSDPVNGHFQIINASWLVDENGTNKIIPLENVESILIDVKQVKMVEFMKMTKEGENV